MCSTTEYEQESFTVAHNRKIASGVYEMRLEGSREAQYTPGTFVQVSLEPFFLRRPISLCDARGSTLTLVYKAVGRGTEYMAALKPGHSLGVLTGLGNGFNTNASGDRPLLIGGGVGLPPLYYLARRLLQEGRRPVVAMGFNRADEVFYYEEFKALCPTYLATADGSLGIRGFVTTAISQQKLSYTHYYACGPLGMLKAVHALCAGGGQLSLEERMACGFGACMGCSIQTKSGAKRVCAEGPVFAKGDLPWA